MTIYTVIKGTNVETCQRILSSLLKQGDRVLDATYGDGTFWRGMLNEHSYKLVKSDLEPSASDVLKVDLLSIDDTFPAGYFNAIIIDPPFITRKMFAGSKQTAEIIAGRKPTKGSKEEYVVTYSQYKRYNASHPLNIFRMSQIAHCLKKDGWFILKIMDTDMQSTGVWYASDAYMRAKGLLDLKYVFIQDIGKLPNARGTSSIRINHNYWMVFKK